MISTELRKVSVNYETFVFLSYLLYNIWYFNKLFFHCHFIFCCRTQRSTSVAKFYPCTKKKENIFIHCVFVFDFCFLYREFVIFVKTKIFTRMKSKWNLVLIIFLMWNWRPKLKQTCVLTASRHRESRLFILFINEDIIWNIGGRRMYSVWRRHFKYPSIRKEAGTLFKRHKHAVVIPSH